MNKELISIIVPIYKVESYLKKCINSIIHQTYNNLEILLIDDGSPDNCPAICDWYAEQDKRIKVIHQKNGGLSSARNTGIEKATGTYLAFIDSDDYIEPDMIEKLYNALITTKADISICNIIFETETKQEHRRFLEKKFSIENETKFKNLYNHYNIATIVAWNKLYKSSIFQNIRYPLNKLNEDEFIIYDILNQAKKITYIDECLYHYIQRNNSIMNSFNLKRLDILEIHEQRINFLESTNQQDILKLEYLSYIQTLVKIILPGLNSIKEYQKNKYYKQKLRQIITKVKNTFPLTKKEKLKLTLINSIPNLYIIVFGSK